VVGAFGAGIEWREAERTACQPRAAHGHVQSYHAEPVLEAGPEWDGCAVGLEDFHDAGGTVVAEWGVLLGGDTGNKTTGNLGSCSPGRSNRLQGEFQWR
jgi:hypothetical protein